MNKRKREETKDSGLHKEDNDEIDEAFEEKIDLHDEEKSASSEEEGEDLMNDMEK